MTERLAKFWRLSGAERRLLFSAFAYLLATRVALLLFSFRPLVKRSLAAVAAGNQTSSLPPQRIAWVIRAASRALPGGGNCLLQALAIHPLLLRHGHPARIRIGVAKAPGGQLKAHAWVECAGAIVIGGRGVAHFSPLPDWEVQPG